MKIIRDELNFTIFLNNFYTKELDFNNKETLEDYFKTLFFKIKDNYRINIAGFYNIYIYIDSNYGIILDVFKEDLDYFDYFGNSIDMQITKPINTNFLYIINDPLEIPKEILKKFHVYKNINKFYLKCKKNITNAELGIILEHAKIIFNEDIIKNEKLIEVKL